MEKRYLTWNDNFDGVVDFIEQLDDKNRNLVVIIDPHIKVDKNYFLYREALEKGMFQNLLLRLFY